MTDDTARPSRRQVLAAGGIGAAAALLPTGSAATAATDDLITRPLPGTGERVPALGLGTFQTFDTQSQGYVTEVLRRFWEAGGRVVDTSPVYGAAERNVGVAAGRLGITERLFVTNKVWSTGEYLWDDSHAARGLRRSMDRLDRRRPIDVMQCHSLVNVDVVVPLLHAWKKEGRVARIGVTHHEPDYFGILAKWVEAADLDVVQVHYSIHTRLAEERVLRAAADRGTAVLVNMPLEKGRLLAVTRERPLPGFVAEYGIRTWSQYFLKWAMSHPAVTCVLAATANPDHMRENAGAMHGRLPDPDTRERMARHMATVPGFDQVGRMPWYPGRTYPGLVSRAQAALRRRSPWWPS